ncbi:MAG TPA: hypothetical protein DCX03_02430 [Bacteroidales bacterium]|nr:hypothetical protein [Bacteroidales bacterium]
MIIAKNSDAPENEFVKLLTESNDLVHASSKEDPSRYENLTSSEFEEEVFDKICRAAVSTNFHNKVKLIRGHRFPDIVAEHIVDQKFFGVEVKITKNDKWTSTGNSVLESTRVEKVERIYLYFGKLVAPPEFMFRKYEECLYEIAVTHSPRYLIDMNLKRGETIFDKMGIAYDDLRKSANPINVVVNHYRKSAQPGEEPWWMGTDESQEGIVSPTVRLWNHLAEYERRAIKNEAFARFPEIFGNSQTKYNNLASWLAAKHGVVASSLRDSFSAGGQVSISIGRRRYEKLPQVFKHLKDNIKDVIDIVLSLTPDDVAFYWRVKDNVNQEDIVTLWIEQIIANSKLILDGDPKFIVHLLSDAFGRERTPEYLRAQMADYGFDF